MSKYFTILLVATIVGPHVLLKAADVEQSTPPAGQEERIAADIARLESSNESERTGAMKALVKLGKPAVPALVNLLNDPRNDVRAFAAETLRSILAAEPTNASNYHEKAFWEQRLAQLKAGMALDEALKVLLPDLSPAERRKTLQSMFGGGGGSTSTYRLDDYWTIVIYSFDQIRSQTNGTDRQGLQHNPNTNFEQGSLSPTPPVLVRSVRQVWVAPPPDYTGIWATWHVNGQKAHEIQYRNGKYDGTFIAFYDDGPKCYRQHYTMGICHGTSTGWYRSENKHYEGQYENGKQTGTWQWWTEDGQVESIREYKDGKALEK